MTEKQKKLLPKVLVVEDEADLADLFAMWLEGTNDVAVAYDYETAVDTIDDTFDVALLDRQLPDGSGDDVLEQIRDEGLDCRVAMVTAVEQGPDIVEKGFDEYVRKPVTADELRDAVDRLVLQGRYRTEVAEFYRQASERARREAHPSETTYQTESPVREPIDDVGRELSDVAISLSETQTAAEYHDM